MHPQAYKQKLNPTSELFINAIMAKRKEMTDLAATDEDPTDYGRTMCLTIVLKIFVNRFTAIW